MMEPFIQLEGIGAPMPKINVDTDAIIAVQHVYTLTKSGLGKYLFHRWRYANDGSELAEFVLNQKQFRNASILVARANFGCGSSREHAVWALADYGFRCIIAPSFASIFYENCIKNGVLPIILDESLVERLLSLLEHNAHKSVAVDLGLCQIKFPDGAIQTFEIENGKRDSLMQGLDPITAATKYEKAISAFQEKDLKERPWVWRQSK
jgi:3-isopropylmalate/(R)-2-methylmalate dehydratase small subunit